MTDNEPPECGFIEREDGSIEFWGSTWEPGPHAGPEPICIEYHLDGCGAWIPFSVWTKDEEFDVCEGCYKRQSAERADPKRCTNCGKSGKIATRKCIDEHDCDWIADIATLYHHESGGNCDGVVYVDTCARPDRVPCRIWIAEGVTVVNGWEGGIKGCREKTPLTDAALLAMGYRRVHGPVPDPFAGGIEGDTFYDERTGQRVPDEYGRLCGCCNELFAEHDDDLVVVNEYEATDEDIAGLYRRLSRWSTLWVCPLPHNMDRDAERICSKCSARAVVDYGLHDLLLAWQADPEVMADEQRETLLDAVRERVDEWIAGDPDVRADKVHEWFARDLADRLDLTGEGARRLCEDAGYGGTHG